MRLFFSVTTTLLISSSAFASNWERFDGSKTGQKCTPSYYMNMKETERPEPNKVKITQKSYGHAAIGFIELNASASKENLPIFGEVLDIFVEKIKTVDGYDYWKECTPKNLRPAK